MILQKAQFICTVLCINYLLEFYFEHRTKELDSQILLLNTGDLL